MTSYKTTFLLAFIFAGLGMYLYTIEVPTIEQETVQHQEAQRLIPFDYRDVTEIKMTSRRETIRLTRDNRRRWSVIEPIKAKGDSREVENILRALEIGKVSRVIQQEEEKKDLSEYGLDSPNSIIQLTAGAQSETLSLGGVAPLTGTLYAKRESDKHILLTTLSVTDFRKKSLFTFRHKDVMFFDRAMVDRIQLHGPTEPITLDRVSSIHGATGNWRFSEPFEGPADKTSVGLLLMTLEDLTALEFIDKQSEKEALLQRLPPPLFTATVHTGPRAHLVTFFQSPKLAEETYALTAADRPIYKISPATLKRLPTQAFDIQDKRLFGIEMAEIGLLTVTTGTGTFTVSQQHGEWYLDGAPDISIDQHEMQLFVSRVVDLPAELAISFSQEHLGEFGLATPTIEIIGVDTRGRPRGYLALGTRGKGLVYALGSGLPGVYQARSAILTQMPTSDNLWSGKPK